MITTITTDLDEYNDGGGVSYLWCPTTTAVICGFDVQGKSVISICDAGCKFQQS